MILASDRGGSAVKPAMARGPGRGKGVSVKIYFEDLVCITPILHYSIGQHVMGSLKKRRKAKINKHKRRKKLRLNRHKKRTWQQ
jgi:hypothetical protein